MAYLVFTAKGQELGRRPLTAATVIGRSPECDISVRDILLSRRHCQVEQADSGWVAVDLESKNGTFISGERITRQPLRDGQTIEIGQTRVTFRAGELAGITTQSKQPLGSRRPADPWEAMAGTVTGFDYAKSRIDVQRAGRKTARPLSMFPKPQPSPADPGAYAQEDLYTMLTEIASSSWDSIYSNASRRVLTRPLPRPVVSRHARPVSTPQREVLAKTTQQLLNKADRKFRQQRFARAVSRVIKGAMAVGQSVLILSPIWWRG